MSAALVVLLAAGCGTRLEHDRLLAAAQGTPPAGATATGVTGSDAGANSTGAPSTVPGEADEATDAPVLGGEGPLSGATGGAAAPGEPATAGPEEQACTGSEAPIVIGTVGQQSGIVGQAIAGGPKAVQAWVASINARGGLKCHQLRYIVKDDGGDPSRHQSMIRDLIERDHAIAVVQSNAGITGESSVDYLTQKRIPVIGNEGGSEWFYTSPMYFTQASTGSQTPITAMAVARDQSKALGDNHVATITCIEAPGCTMLRDVAPAQARRFGLDLVYRGEVSIVQPDYSSTCQAARDAGAKIVVLAVDTNSMSRVARSCSSVNYKPQYVQISSTAGRADDPRLDGLAIAQQTLPWMVDGSPAIDEYRSALAEYAPGLQPDAATVVGWVSAKLFELAVTRAADPTTSEGLLEGLWSIRDDDLGGLTYPLTFTKGQNSPRVACYWNVLVAGGKYTSPDGGVRVCV